MDVEHWFAPIYDSSRNTDYVGDYLYLSTDKVVPFDVKIYSGNVEIDKVSISKDNPQYVLIPLDIVTTTSLSNVFFLKTAGLHVTGDYKFFANLRILRTNHAEIINSKGLAGLGKTFYAAMAPLYDYRAYYNSQIGIIATENNTKVDISGFDPTFVFSDGSSYPSGISVTLQRGESYIISAPYNPSTLKGLIGAKIEADHPISVTNGNATGTYINSNNTDILMDQSVPIERLGDDHVIAKGNGIISSTSTNPLAYEDDMERVLVIATNPTSPTDIYVNGVFYKTLNAGEFDFVYSNSYVDIDGSGNYSMSVKSVGGDIYVYQFLAGTDDASTTNATGGMNMIPSLNCFLPNKIVELPELNEIGPRNFNTKINVISQTGANVFLNSTKLLGHPIPGNPNWELFVENDVTGNVSIFSDKAATAGIASGNGAVGFGGYFAGFSSIPNISKVGDCAKGQSLDVDDGYDYYRWEHNGVLLDEGSSLNSINPVSYFPANPKDAEGYYVCIVTKIGCKVQATNTFTYLNCPDLVSLPEYTIGNCESTNPIPVEFKGLPSAPINFGSIVVIKQPEGGSVTKPYYNNGKIYINYNADNTNLEKVTFDLFFEDTDLFPNSQVVTITVNIAQIKLQNQEDTQCLDFDKRGIYNLENIFEIPVNKDPTYSKYEYFEDKALTKKIPELNMSDQYHQVKSYKSEPGKTVYVKVTNIYGCDNRSKPAEISLKTFELPQINTIDVKGETSVTINATKGKTPYLYYIKKDGDIKYLPAFSEYSSSNLLPIKDGKGIYTVYVKSADNCNPVTQIFAVVGISNIITPNDDGKNDVINMSMLSYKLNPNFQIFNRNGTKVFEGNTSNNFIWTGKMNGTSLPTATYWYILQWQDYDGAEPDIQTGWILLKNRNSD